MTDTAKNRIATHPLGAEANDLRARSLASLDFPTIREQLAQHAMLPTARELAHRLTPSYRVDEVERLQQETAEGLAFLEMSGDLSLPTSEDVSSVVERASLEGTLSGLELLAVARSLDAQRRVRSALLRVRSTVPELARMAEGISDLREVQQRIEACIGGRGEVLDDATPILREMRQHVRGAYERVTAAIEDIIQSPLGRETLQDRVISTRGDRLVVQVKTELRQRVPGIVHDASNTGATLFIEPFATVDLCNAWRELVLEEERETARVLRDLSALVGEVAHDINLGAELAARLDLILARARFSNSLGSVAAMAPPRPAGGLPEGVRLLKARHPLLGDEAVPISVSIGPGWSTLVITGPNTGGKTVAMKTVGLLALMHQSGLHIPADEGSALPVFDGIYADVGDQQSIHRSVSTFGSHMSNVIGILRHATSGSLVLLDELGTSTDPEEGSALAKAILVHLAARGMATVATTHHRSVAAHAEVTPGMMNASVDLDTATLRPTYELAMGVPGQSYAMSVATQLGLPDEIMEGARSLLEPQYLRFEDWLNELQEGRRQLREKLEEAEEARARGEAARREMEAQVEDMALRRQDILHTMRRELADEAEEVRKKLRRAEAALSWGASAGHVQEARAEVGEAVPAIEALKPPASEEPHRPGRRPLAVGDVVEVRGLGLRGTVMTIPEGNGEVEVAVGDVRLRLDAYRLSPVEEQEEGPGDGGVRDDLGPHLQASELDLRGSRAEDALMRVEEFLDKGLRDGLSSVRIIHGRGTGALRSAIRELLECHPLAKSFAPEAPENGGDGATVVELL